MPGVLGKPRGLFPRGQRRQYEKNVQVPEGSNSASLQEHDKTCTLTFCVELRRTVSARPYPVDYFRARMD